MSTSDGYPDFLIIGAPKAGTGWYFDNLKRHPQVWMPPYKSVQYFSGWAALTRRKRFKGLKRRILGSLRREGIGWNLRHFCGRIDDNWYKAVFAPGRGLLTGEASPSYCALDAPAVAKIRALMPNVKIIYSLRNPVERSWSNAMLYFVRNQGRAYDSLTDDELVAFFEQSGDAVWNNYIETHALWSRHFSPEQILITYFEQIAAEPETLLHTLCGFLGLEPDLRHFKVSARRNLFKGPVAPRAMSPAVTRYLADKYLPLTRMLHDRFGGYATEWYRQTQQAVQEV